MGPSARAFFGGVRRLSFLYLVFGCFGLQLATGAGLLGAELPVTLGFWLLLALWPVSPAPAAFVAVRSFGRAAAPLRWPLAGLLVFALWAGGYFLIGATVDPARIRTVPELVEPLLPLVPATVFLYLCVHPLTLMPYFVVDDARAYQRLLLGHLFIVTVSLVCWSAFPVTAVRPELPAGEGLSLWTLGVIYGTDPSVNCLPSTHCAMALFSALALREVFPRLGNWAIASAYGIALTTLLLKQHYLLDVITGLSLAYGAWLLARKLVPVDVQQPLLLDLERVVERFRSV
ncbi:MAG: phosphatase PAP2 family protein [Myxococcales bacterium]